MPEDSRANGNIREVFKLYSEKILLQLEHTNKLVEDLHDDIKELDNRQRKQQDEIMRLKVLVGVVPLAIVAVVQLFILWYKGQ